MDILIRIIAPHFVAGLVVRGDRVARAAPILRYMVGWDMATVAGYCGRKRWGCERVGL